ncbi:hypothetical protein FF38_10540 [Lucilia cuprina]|uniref:Uncharacterized protein n=1 Tax=Lucilia cuprina TaxID=7375 RepID=A0A0L0BWR9_LUCCU|nr:hypothetical protein FF38_10540 [Lucilia cuprina]
MLKEFFFLDTTTEAYIASVNAFFDTISAAVAATSSVAANLTQRSVEHKSVLHKLLACVRRSFNQKTSYKSCEVNSSSKTETKTRLVQWRFLIDHWKLYQLSSRQDGCTNILPQLHAILPLKKRFFVNTHVQYIYKHMDKENLNGWLNGGLLEVQKLSGL